MSKVVTRQSFFNKFGLYSLKQRYLAVTFIVLFVLSISAIIGVQYVKKVNEHQLEQIQNRSESSDSLADVILQLHSLETDLQKFITIPNEENQKNIHRAFELYNTSINALLKNDWINQDPAHLELVHGLKKDQEVLYNEVNKLISIRLDESKWFPAMEIMREKMIAQNLEFITALDFLLQEASTSLRSKSDVDLYKLLNEIRHNWQLLISEFRLFVANSFGVFSSNPQAGMDTRQKNIELYLKNLSHLLDQLDIYLSSGSMDDFSEHAVQDLRYWKIQWTNSYYDVLATFKTELWRNDLVLLEEEITPLLKRIRQRASSLQLELSVNSAKDITHLLDVARTLSDWVLFITIALTLFSVVGYILFNRTILKPIANVANALNNQALNKDSKPIVISQAKEITNLTDAFEDMQQQIQQRQEHLDHMAHHDALTGLPNRTLFHDRLETAIGRSQRDQTIVGLLFLDLDRFKQINDSLGHDVGDKLLQVVASRISSCVRSTDTVARLGGDEFAIVVEGVEHGDQIALLANKILNAFSTPYMVDNHELHSSTSIGIAMGPNDDSDADALIKDADIAMYHAKDLGRNNYKFYSADMASQVAEHLALETQLRRAIENEEFVLYYQPIVSLLSGEIISTEALLRWNHPQRGLLLPSEFLHILEDSGLIRPVTKWILEQASLQYMKFKQTGFADIRMSVNLSGKLIKGDFLTDIIINVLHKTQMDPHGLLMEITEDTLIEDLHSSEKALNNLQNMGIRIALDDFGTGQSSLNHLRTNPIDVVKIDRDFVNDIPGDRNDSELVDAIIAMAHKLHVKVIAEGVETKEQLEFLRWHKCDAVQGFYCCKPVTGDEILRLLQENLRMLG